MIHADHRPIGRDGLHLQAVDLQEFERLRGRGAGHPAYRRVQRHQVLERDLAEDHSLRLGRHAFLGFDRRVQTGRPAAVERDPALELVHHLDGAVLHDVVDVAVQQSVGVQRFLHGPVNRQVAIVEEIPASEGALHGVDSGVGQRDVVASRIDGEVLAGRAGRAPSGRPRRPGRGRPIRRRQSPAERAPRRSGWSRPRR